MLSTERHYLLASRFWRMHYSIFGQCWCRGTAGLIGAVAGAHARVHAGGPLIPPLLKVDRAFRLLATQTAGAGLTNKCPVVSSHSQQKDDRHYRHRDR